MTGPKAYPRIHKLLAAAGYGSRREMERWIQAGRITLNGEPAKPGSQYRPGDRVLVDGRLADLEPEKACRLLIYNKPAGVLCTRKDAAGRPLVFDRLPDPGSGRWVSVGRLDINSEGLLLVTNDGELANRLMHPRYGFEREYRCRVRGRVTRADIDRLRHGVTLDDGPARFDSISADGGAGGANRWFTVVVSEGRNREVRRLFEAVGAEVSRLIRVRYGPFRLPADLTSDHWIEISPERFADLEDRP